LNMLYDFHILNLLFIHTNCKDLHNIRYTLWKLPVMDKTCRGSNSI
jgi:hypothetical protein